MSEELSTNMNIEQRQLPGQEQLFDPTPLTPEQEHVARVEAVFSSINPNAIGNQPTKLEAPLSSIDEAAHKDALDYLKITKGKGDLLPDSLRIKRDWADNLSTHNQKQIDHVAATVKNLEVKLGANDEAHEIRSRHQEINTHNYTIKARDTERANRIEAKEAFLADHAAAARAEKTERAAVRKAFTNREKLLRGEFQSQLFKKEIRAAAKDHVEKTLGPAKYGKLTPELQAKLEKSAEDHVESIFGPALYADHGIVDTDKLKSESSSNTKAGELSNQKTSSALKEFQRGFAGDNESKPEKPEAVEAVDVYYKSNNDSLVQTAVELTRKGDGVDLAVLEDGEVLLTTEDTTFYVNGKCIDNLGIIAKNAREKTNLQDGWEFNSTDDLPVVRVGEHLIIDGSSSGLIKKIEIKQQEKNRDDLGEEWESRGPDPFKIAEQLASDDQGAGKEAESKLSGRTKRLMDWAHNQLDKLKLLPLNVMSGANEFYGNKEKRRKRIIASVAGALVVGAGAYVAMKSGLVVGGGSKASPDSLGLTPGSRAHSANSMNSLLTTAPKPSAANTVAEVTPHVNGSGIGKEHIYQTVTVRSAQNPWTISDHQLRARGIAHPTVAQIEDFDKQMAHLNSNIYSYYGDSSEHILPGTKLKLPK